MIKCINDADLQNVSLSNKDNFVKLKYMNVGFSATAAFAALRKSDLVTKKKVADFFLMLSLFCLYNRKKDWEEFSFLFCCSLRFNIGPERNDFS